MHPILILSLAAATSAAPRPTDDEAAALRASFGFVGFEIYELGDGVFDLAPGDLNGDGTTDLVFVNNGRARVEALLRLDPDAEDWVDPTLDDEESNPIEYDGRYRHVRLPVERPIYRLAAGDLDGDGGSDVAWAEQGGRLVATFDLGGSETERRTWTTKLDELRRGCDLLEAVDVDGDGDDDLLVLGDGTLLLLAADGAGGFAAPEVVDHFGGRVDRIHAIDLDGDGQRDLLYTHHNADYPFRFRLRGTDGLLGPRVEIDLPQVRSSAVEDLDGDGQVDVVGVMKASGRLTAWELDPAGGQGRTLLRYSLRTASGAGGERAFAVGDLDGDGRADVAVSEPESARIALHFGRPGGRALETHTEPSFVGVDDPRMGDLDGDGRAELVVRSAAERMIGFSTWEPAGRLPFPTTRPVDGEPTAMEVVDLDGDGFDDVVAALSQGEGRKRVISLGLWLGSEAGLADEPRIQALPQVKKAPSALSAADLNRDGRPDLLVFVPGDDAVPTLLVQTADGGFVADERGEEAPGLGTLKGAAPQQLSWVDADGDGQMEVLAASGNFARALVFDVSDDGALTPQVLEQFNGPTVDAAIRGSAVLDLDGDGVPEVVLRNGSSRELLVYRRKPDGSAELDERIEAGRLDFAGFVTADCDGDGRDDLVVLGRDQFAVLYADTPAPALRELSSYDPRRERVFLDQIETGDLNGDGHPDLVITEAQRHALVLFSAKDAELRRALGFKTFEESDLSGGSSTREPRELVCADFDGDGRDDLAILVHDKLILYVQE